MKGPNAAPPPPNPNQGPPPVPIEWSPQMAGKSAAAPYGNTPTEFPRAREEPKINHNALTRQATGKKISQHNSDSKTKAKAQRYEQALFSEQLPDSVAKYGKFVLDKLGVKRPEGAVDRGTARKVGAAVVGVLNIAPAAVYGAVAGTFGWTMRGIVRPASNFVRHDVVSWKRPNGRDAAEDKALGQARLAAKQPKPPKTPRPSGGGKNTSNKRRKPNKR